jgi:hypothetical protein
MHNVSQHALRLFNLSIYEMCATKFHLDMISQQKSKKAKKQKNKKTTQK